MKKKSRLKILPDRIFHKMWDEATNTSLLDFIHTFTSPLSKEYIDFYRRYDIEPLAASDMLSHIHKRANQSLKAILEEAGIKKSEVYHCFCVPKRTLDDWYTGVNRCPSYFRLVLLKQYHLLSLGKYIILESEKKYRSTFPPIYEKSESATNIPAINNPLVSDVQPDVNHEADSDAMSSLLNSPKRSQSGRFTYAEVEKMLSQGNPRDVMDSDALSQLLRETDYLSNRGKKTDS